MKILLIALISNACLAALGFEQRPAIKASQRLEIERLMDRLASDPISIPSADASNRLFALRASAVPLLVELASNLDYKDQRQITKIGAACGVLGTNAYPILNQVAKGLPSEDFHTAEGAACILFAAGSSAFSILIAADKSKEKLLDPGTIKHSILGRVDAFPVDSITELIRLYRKDNRSPELQKWIELAFRQGLHPEDNRIAPFLKGLLKEDDPFIVLLAIDYVERSIHALPLKEDVGKLCDSPYAAVRNKATNFLDSFKPIR